MYLRAFVLSIPLLLLTLLNGTFKKKITLRQSIYWVFLILFFSLSLSLSSLYDRIHRPLYGNISYEGSGMIPG